VIAVRDGSSGWKSSLKYAKRDENGVVTEVNSPWFAHFNEMGKKTVIRRIAKFLPMSVQRAAAFDELADAGKPVAINDYGEVVIDDTAVIDNETGEVKQKSKLDEFAGAAKKAPKKRSEAKPQAAAPETAEDVAAPTVEDYLEDIANVPTVEGLDHKFEQASLNYKDDAAAMAQLTLAKTKRKKALEAPKEEVIPPQPGSGKKLFQHADEPEGAAA